MGGTTVFCGITAPPVCEHSDCTPVLEAVGDQLSFGQVIEPSQLPAAVSAGVERREALVAPLQLHTHREREEGVQTEV